MPDYQKYWVFSEMLRLERYEKGEEDKPGRFPERPSGRQRSIKMFPEVNERGLKFIAQAVEDQNKNQTIHFPYDIPEVKQTEFSESLQKKDFRALYGWGQEYIPPISDEEMQTTKGRWVTYPQGSDAKALSQTLQGKGSGWCIAGENVAQDNYLDHGDVSIYYTRDKAGNFTNPRVVITKQADRVTEVRGIEWEQNVDNYIKETNIIGDKLKELPGGKEFFATDTDTKRLTTIDRKITSGVQLDGSELAFLYEVDGPIKYFGYKKDPRIAELRSKRNPQEDMPIILGCERNQIATDVGEITSDTKAYVGPIARTFVNPATGQEKLLPEYKNIFQKLINIDQIYTSFPEGKISRQTDEVGGKTAQQLETEFEQAKVNMNDITKGVMHRRDFTTLPTQQSLETVQLTVKDLGFNKGTPTTNQIYKRAAELGLDLCPAELGPHRRLKDVNQPMDDFYIIGMKPITAPFGTQDIFYLTRNEDELWLRSNWAVPDSKWNLAYSFVFCLRPSAELRTSKQSTQNFSLLHRIFKR